jgi:hypothetical protein
LTTAASPPNGLKEAYQRVVDAEIASAMGIEEREDHSMGELTIYHYN